MIKVCFIDVDGVLNYYPEAWLQYLSDKGKKFKSVDEAKNSLTYHEYTTYKEQYRESTYKRDQPVRVGAVEFTSDLYELGYEVIIKTQRPVIEHPHLVEWTYNWLNEHGFTYYDVIFVRYNLTDSLVYEPDFIVDDELEVVRLFDSYGVKSFHFTGSFDKILSELKNEDMHSYIT